jgi:Tol biopolymer transport system component
MDAVRFVLTMPQGNTEASGPATPNVVPSPDGRELTFVARDTSSGKQYLWVRPLNSVEAHLLDKTEGASQPFWSPDGQFIAYFADDKLKRIGVAGGPPQTVCDMPKRQTMGSYGESGTWSKDGVIVLGSYQGLLRVSATGGMATTLTTVEQDESYHGSPQFLPDGRHLIYFVQSVDVAKRGVYIQELGTSHRVQVLKSALKASWSPPGYLLFIRESTLFAQRMKPNSFQLEGQPIDIAEDVSANEGNGRAAFAVSDNGVLVYRWGGLSRTRQLAWYDRDGKRLDGIGKPMKFTGISLSPNELSLAMAVGAPGASETWIMDLNSGVMARPTLDFRSSLTLGPWSPDSQRMAINHEFSGGISELIVASEKTRRLVPDTLEANDWSPDGSFLLCTTVDRHQLSVLPLEGDSKPRTIMNTPYQIRSFRFSPDGRWVAYHSDQGGRFEIWVASYPSFGEKRQISNGGIGPSPPVWRRDGNAIFFVALDATVMSVELKTGSRLEARSPVPLFKLPSRFTAPLAAAADGKRFLVAEDDRQSREPQIRVAVNWVAELKQH